jgi:hypothetical protein
MMRHWRKYPPMHRLMAAYVGFEPEYTTEEQVARGAMGPLDMLEHFKRTGGKVDTAHMPGAG